MKTLKTTLILNALSCLAFGTLMTAASSDTNRFLENPILWLTPTIGAALIVNAVHLLIASQRKKIITAEIMYFVAGDFLWVVATLFLVASKVVVVSQQGAIAVLLIAAMVGTFGICQLTGYRKVG